MDEQKVPEFSAVQRAEMAEVHGVTLDVPHEWKRGDWMFSDPNYWMCIERTGVGDSMFLAWNGVPDSGGGWLASCWLHDDAIEASWCDPPESWIAAGRPGAIDEQVAILEEHGRAASQLLRAVLADPELGVTVTAEKQSLVVRKHLGLLSKGGQEDRRALLVEIDRLRSGAIDERPSGVWKCTEHGVVSSRPNDPVNGWCADATPAKNETCRWVELVYPASEEQP